MELVQMDDYRKLVEGRLRPAPESFETLDVNVNVDSPVFVDLATHQYNQMASAVQATGGHLPFSEKDWKLYLNTLVKERVLSARGERTGRVFFGKTFVRVPALLDVILKNLGHAKDDDLGIQLLPAIDPKVETLPLAEVQRISAALKVVENHGFSFAEELPRVKDGDWQFMSMSVVGEFVKAHAPDRHGVYAVLASTLLYETAVSSLLNLRVNYGPTSLMKSLLIELTEQRR